MSESGLVVSREGDKVVVKMERTEACAKCRACSIGAQSTEMIVHAVNACDAQVNDTVSIELEAKGFLQAVFIMYGMPLLSMLFGFVAGYYSADKLNLPADGEILGFVLGMLLMAATYLIIKSSEKKRDKVKYTPIATSVLNK